MSAVDIAALQTRIRDLEAQVQNLEAAVLEAVTKNVVTQAMTPSLAKAPGRKPKGAT